MRLSIITLVVLIFSITACGASHDGDPGGNGGAGDIIEGELTFIDDVLPIVQNRCTLCHNEGSGLPVWENYEVLFKKKDIVRRRVFETQDMPRGNATEMTQEERVVIAQWIDEGAVFE